jgi:putative ABC transport system substrate-binding protein
MNHARRLFLLAAGAIAFPAAPQVPGRVYRVGMIVNGDPRDRRWKPFDDQLAGHGFVAGKNLELKRIGDSDSVAGAVAGYSRELIEWKAEAIVVEGSGRARVVIGQTKTVPIVLAGAADPVGSGFVRNLSRPGGNVTGVSNQECELVKKRFEIIRQLVPAAKRVTLVASVAAIPCKLTKEALVGPDSPLDVVVIDARGGPPTPAMQEALRTNPDVLLPFGISRGRDPEGIRKALEGRRIPIVSDDSWGTDAVVSLVHDSDAIGRSCADQVAKILGGANPGDIPVELVAKFELVVNNRRAREIGLQVPEAILLRADRVLE